MAKVISQGIATGRRLRASGMAPSPHSVPADERTLASEFERVVGAMGQNASLSPLMSECRLLSSSRAPDDGVIYVTSRCSMMADSLLLAHRRTGRKLPLSLTVSCGFARQIRAARTVCPAP